MLQRLARRFRIESREQPVGCFDAHVGPGSPKGSDLLTTKISVVICTRDRSDLIGQAVKSVAACDYPVFDLHVMDQSSDDSTRDVVVTLQRNLADRCAIHYHHLEQPGLSRAYNAGFRVTDAPIVACTDDDVVVPADWLTRISRSFDADAQVGLLYGQVLVPPSLTPVDPETIVPTLEWTEKQRLHRSDHNFKIWGMGANMAVRREVMGATGGFDEMMGGGAPLRSSQDFDFALRVYRVGFAVLLDPEVTVDHYGARTTAQWPGTLVAYGIGDGAFYGKHVRCRDPLAAWLLLKKIAYVIAKIGTDSVRDRKPVGLSIYGRNLFRGLRLGARYDVDRGTRLYRENDRARSGVTEANVVAGARRTG
jgi:glycosyltransferase involved in cell wall biosynthesis